jgi:hypothetical protein
VKTIQDIILLANTPRFTAGNDVMKTAVAEVCEEQQKRAVGQVKGLITTFTNVVDQQVASLRMIRENEKITKQNLDKLNTALEYFGETGNPFPFFYVSNNFHGMRHFAQSVGIPVPAADSEDAKVPDSFKPKAKTEESAKKSK